MARDGWTVAASARDAKALDRVAAAAVGGRIVPVPLDVTDLAACRAAVGRVEEEIGPVVTAVLAAGTHIPVAAAAFDAATVRKLVEVNLMGVVNAVDAVLPSLIERRAGRLAIVSSVAGYRGLPTAAGYGATKAGLINFAESLKFDLDRLGIVTQVVCPGFVRTPLTDRNPFPMPFLMEVEDAAERLYRGLQGNAFEIAFPWRFALILKLLGLLPDALYFALMHRATGK
ncbi:oxidoreductase [Thalassobaculum fulvum]|uniref:Oxidoreductase n=2 Tax=Thalassobaculum fulvum TaxID=1633335 RepID=A0A918XNU5_9PROT|nr:oxidoreductase [Thalassobaculum fulvum]